MAQHPGGFTSSSRLRRHKNSQTYQQARSQQTPPSFSRKHLKTSKRRIHPNKGATIAGAPLRPVRRMRRHKPPSNNGFLLRLCLVFLVCASLLFALFSLAWWGTQQALALFTDKESVTEQSSPTFVQDSFPASFDAPIGLYGQSPQGPITAAWPRYGFSPARMLPLPIAAPNTELQSTFENIQQRFGTQHIAHVYFYDPQSGQEAGLNAQTPISAASVIKLPLLLATLKAVENQELSPEQLLVMTQALRVGGSGRWQYEPVDTAHPLIDTAAAMIQSSDNSATNMIIQSLGGLQASRVRLLQMGFQQTALRNWLPDLDGYNTLSPKEMVQLLFNLQEGLLLGSEQKMQAIDILMKTENRSLIVASVPPDVMVAHKTGNIGTSLGDSGIIFLPDGRYYYLSVMVQRPFNSQAARDLVQALSKAAYESMSIAPTAETTLASATASL